MYFISHVPIARTYWFILIKVGLSCFIFAGYYPLLVKSNHYAFCKYSFSAKVGENAIIVLRIVKTELGASYLNHSMYTILARTQSMPAIRTSRLLIL